MGLVRRAHFAETYLALRIVLLVSVCVWHTTEPTRLIRQEPVSS